ncbi:hypothetical protein INS49_010011 [Diaporthe citri]|uniref:uncharacterized protein n=1 Tax=Diaporthe citri TaxID=83186 RepID=UPI001C813643|nr:uncharacterized protein INS49_010011 [Diaporthe citri]KAG6361782.1 hypothetical protein INS49_010011 [Diaporthe citri]
MGHSCLMASSLMTWAGIEGALASFQSRPSPEEARAAYETPFPPPAALEVAILIFPTASIVALASVDAALGCESTRAEARCAGILIIRTKLVTKRPGDALIRWWHAGAQR